MSTNDLEVVDLAFNQPKYLYVFLIGCYLDSE